MILVFETPQQYLCVASLVFGALLFEFGFRAGLDEFLFQSYVVGVLGTGSSLINVVAPRPDWHPHWLPLAIAAALHYAVSMRVRFGGRERLGQSASIVGWFTSGASAGLLVAIAWKLVPGDYLGVAWLAVGAALFELGLRELPSQFRRFSYVVSAVGFFNLLAFHVVSAQKGSPAAEPISLGIAALLCYGLTGRLFREMPNRIGDQERRLIRDLNVAAGTLFVMTLAWLELAAPVVALAWTAMSLILLELGFGFALPGFRLIGNLVSAAAFGRVLIVNFDGTGITLGISHRLLTVVPILISQYYVGICYRRNATMALERSLVRVYLYAPALL